MMKYDPEIHNRQSIRINDFDYNQNGAYFITVCTLNRCKLFGHIKNGQVYLSEYGNIVDNCIDRIPLIYRAASIPGKVVMPNHIHFVIVIENDNSSVGVAYHATPQCHQDCNNLDLRQKSKMLLPKIIQQFKAATIRQYEALQINMKDGRQCNHGFINMQPLRWQRNYYEHVIRSAQEYREIMRYIDINPLKWFDDIYYQ